MRQIDFSGSEADRRENEVEEVTYIPDGDWARRLAALEPPQGSNDRATPEEVDALCALLRCSST